MSPIQKFSIWFNLIIGIPFLLVSSNSPMISDGSENVYIGNKFIQASINFQPTNQGSFVEIINVRHALVKLNAQTTPEPLENSSAEVEADAGTPTPTPIPIQRGSTNFPIVIGAFTIILVITLAWFFIGYLPTRNRE